MNSHFTLLGGENNQFQLLLQQDDQSFISQPLTLLNNKARELAVREGRVHDEPQAVQLQPLNGEAIDQAAPIRAIVDHRTHLSALDLVLPEGNIHLTLSSLRKFAAQKPLYTQLVDGAVLKSGVVIKDGNLLRDNQSGELMLPNGDTGFYQYIDAEGHFVGKGIAPGFVVSVGWKNFVRIMTDPGIQGPFMQIFVWTVIFSACSVAFTLAIGMVMACLVQWEQLRGRGFYRVMLILPYAIPAFISILVFKGLFNQNFGEINLFLEAAFGIKPDWYTTPFLAKVMILIVNTWLGYPYMMILCMGLLKAIPEDLYEASAMDGAGPVQNFFKITVPLLMKPLTPLLIASFAFNFNNFVLIQLLTNGAPDIIRGQYPGRDHGSAGELHLPDRVPGLGWSGLRSGQCHRHRHLPDRRRACTAQPEIVQSGQAVRRLLNGYRTTQISEIPGVGNPPGHVGLPGADHLPGDHGYRHLVP